MHRLLILGALGLVVGGLGVTHFKTLENRLDDLDRRNQEVPRQTRSIENRIDTLGGELAQIRELVQRLADEPSPVAQQLLGRLNEIEGEIGQVRTSVELTEGGLAALESQRDSWSPDTITKRMAELSEGVNRLQLGVDERWNGISSVISATVSMAEQNKNTLQDLDGEVNRDVSKLWQGMVGPTVQLAGEMTVGSGVLLKSQPIPGTDTFETLLITAWHVVRDIRADSGEKDPPIPVSIYTEGGGVWYETASLLEYNAELDTALLRLDTKQPVRYGAKLPTRKELEDLRIFDSIYAVGCPLGNDPIPTHGEIADTHHRVDGNTYWMISAPTYIGNSGGGIYHAQTGCLLGIFSKIYTHGNLRPTVVPHMGLVTPLTQIYDWLEREGYAKLVSVEEPTGAQLALALER